METVTCDFCGKEFTDCFSAETNQAHQCASDLVYNQDKQETNIFCHYGSDFDTNKYTVIPTSNFAKKNGVICDHCIQHLLDNKEAEQDTSFNYFG